MAQPTLWAEGRMTETLAAKGLGSRARGLFRKDYLDRCADLLSSTAVRLTVLQLLVLLFALRVNKYLLWHFPKSWFLLPLVLAVALARVRFRAEEKCLVWLWQLIGVLSAAYSLFHYPLLPPVNNDWATTALYAAVIAAWIGSLFAGVLSRFVPSLALLPPAFLVWSTAAAQRITGLPILTDLDIMPLNEVAMCIGLGVLIAHATPPIVAGLLKGERHGSAERPIEAAAASFSGLLLLIAVAIHLANYFWSFVAKATLDGPFLAWLTENNPARMFLAALDDDHVLFYAYPGLVRLFYHFVDAVHLYSNFFILIVQGLAIIAFFLPLRAFVLLLIAFDVMHFSIIVLAGINFWPWIILNLIIAAVVVDPRYKPQPLFIRMLATLFILLAPRFVQVAELGWYDSGVNNKLFFEAIDKTGKRYAVPTNYFTFYSYSLGDMIYGPVDTMKAFAVGNPTGPTQQYKYFEAGRSCDADALTLNSPNGSPYQQALDTYVRNYHLLATGIERTLGVFPYDVYPHHFYIPLGLSAGFRHLDKSSIVAYVYHQDTVCLSFADGHLERKLIGSFERRIDVDAGG
jgi:hypothetical protein